jgi:hypothetical protein
MMKRLPLLAQFFFNSFSGTLLPLRQWSFLYLSAFLSNYHPLSTSDLQAESIQKLGLQEFLGDAQG